MSINDFLKDAYRVHGNTLTRHKKMQYAKNQFLKKYGLDGLQRYFNGSNKQLWLTIEELTIN